MSKGQIIWMQVITTLNLLIIDPKGLKGAVFRVRAGPVRNKLITTIGKVAGSYTKLHPNMSDEQLFGGLDVIATLNSECLVTTKGLLNNSGWFELTMAERISLQMAARLSQALDQDLASPLIAFDEGIGEERLPDSLKERLAFHFDLAEVSVGDTSEEHFDALPFIVNSKATANDIKMLVLLAEQLGISSARGVIFALNAARANAAANGRTKVKHEDLEIAAELIYPSRTKHLPEPARDPNNSSIAEEPKENEVDGTQGHSEIKLPNELLIEAVKSLLPSDFHDNLRTERNQIKKSGIGFGTQTKSKTRGRPRPSRQGKLNGKNRIDIVATLRAAAPLQKIRKMKSKMKKKVLIYPIDIYVKNFETQAERVIIFAVDASGSSALARLSEAKGAVELMLAQAYSRRDFVALIGFRNTGAEILLPPTRSLVQTKRRLAELPGGGGTPMATGLKAAGEMALQASSKGKTPIIIVLTDGRANITLEGIPDRVRAMDESYQISQWIALSGIKSVIFDVGKRPNKVLSKLAEDMQAAYFALPRADAHVISKKIGIELGI